VLHPFEVQVPGDISSAAFMIAAALLAESGSLLVTHVGLNPTRTGALDVLRRMGANLGLRPQTEVLGEPVGEVTVTPGALRATVVQPAEVPSLIDEIPILAVLASRAEGETVFWGVKELAVKESNRLKLMAENLRAVGVEAQATADELRVVGSRKPPVGKVDTARDHRLAMAFAVLGTVSGANVKLSERASVSVSYPGFFKDLKRIIRG
jgi:3-phosphoshikimate 1-carboxyvinyltransferase